MVVLNLTVSAGYFSSPLYITVVSYLPARMPVMWNVALPSLTVSLNSFPLIITFTSPVASFGKYTVASPSS